MPVFTFEKISSPVRGGPVPAIDKKRRGVIIQIIDRFATARIRRTTAEDITGSPGDKLPRED